MTDAELVMALIEAPVPRDEVLARTAARRLFPMWQALLVGLPIGLIAAAMLGLATSLAIALPLGALVGKPLPAWFGHVSEAAGLIGVALGVWLVVRWMRKRRAQFATLVRTGTIAPATDAAATGLARAIGTSVGYTVARAALGGAIGGTLQQVYGGPIAVAEIDGERIEARTAADARGQFKVPELMLADRTGGYVALMHRAGWIAPQRVLRRQGLASRTK